MLTYLLTYSCNPFLNIYRWQDVSIPLYPVQSVLPLSSFYPISLYSSLNLSAICFLACPSFVLLGGSRIGKKLLMNCSPRQKKKVKWNDCDFLSIYIFDICSWAVRSGQGIKIYTYYGFFSIYLTKCQSQVYIVYIHVYNLFLSPIIHCDRNGDC